MSPRGDYRVEAATEVRGFLGFAPKALAVQGLAFGNGGFWSSELCCSKVQGCGGCYNESAAFFGGFLQVI